MSKFFFSFSKIPRFFAEFSFLLLYVLYFFDFIISYISWEYTLYIIDTPCSAYFWVFFEKDSWYFTYMCILRKQLNYKSWQREKLHRYYGGVME